MHISVYYESGVIDGFDTQSLCAAEPFRKGGTNILTEFRLRLDLLATGGLVLEGFWYELPPSGEERGLAVAPRHPGFKMLLVSPDELSEIAKITCDGELLVWRQGGELINGVKFSGQEILCYSDSATTSINARSLAVFDYLKRAHEGDGKTDEEIAAMLGYTTAALNTIRKAEAANVADDVYEDDAQDDSDSSEEEGFDPGEDDFS